MPNPLDAARKALALTRGAIADLAPTPSPRPVPTPRPTSRFGIAPPISRTPTPTPDQALRRFELRGRDITRHIIVSEASPAQRETLVRAIFDLTPKIESQLAGRNVALGSASSRAFQGRGGRSFTTLVVTPPGPNRQFLSEVFGAGQTTRTIRHELVHQLLGQEFPKTSTRTQHRITTALELSGKPLSEVREIVAATRSRIAGEAEAPLRAIGALMIGAGPRNPLPLQEQPPPKRFRRRIERSETSPVSGDVRRLLNLRR